MLCVATTTVATFRFIDARSCLKVFTSTAGKLFPNAIERGGFSLFLDIPILLQLSQLERISQHIAVDPMLGVRSSRYLVRNFLFEKVATARLPLTLRIYSFCSECDWTPHRAFYAPGFSCGKDTVSNNNTTQVRKGRSLFDASPRSN